MDFSAMKKLIAFGFMQTAMLTGGPAAAQMGEDYNEIMCSMAHQLAWTMHDGSNRRPVGRSEYEQSDAIKALIAAYPASPDMNFELAWSMTDIFFDILAGNLTTAIREYHTWFSSSQCTELGLPTPFEAGLARDLEWFNALKGDHDGG
jgi:hypothetical protein